MEEHLNTYKQACWVVGEVVKGSKKVHMENPEVVEVTKFLLD